MFLNYADQRMFYCAIIVWVSSIFVALYHLYLEITRCKLRNWGIPVLKTDDVGVQTVFVALYHLHLEITKCKVRN